MIDISDIEAKAIKEVFPLAVIIYCLFHVMQAVQRFIRTSANKVPGNQKKNFESGRVVDSVHLIACHATLYVFIQCCVYLSNFDDPMVEKHHPSILCLT